MASTMDFEPRLTLGSLSDEILLEIASHMSQAYMSDLTQTSKRFRLVFLSRYARQILFTGSIEEISDRLIDFSAVHASSTGPIWSFVKCVRFYVTLRDWPPLCLPNTMRPDLVGNFLRKLPAVKEVSIWLTETRSGQPAFRHLLGDATCSWPGFPKLKLTNANPRLTDAVVRRCAQSALQVARLALHPDSNQLQLLASQHPELKRLHIDIPAYLRHFPLSEIESILEDICEAFPHLEWLVLEGVYPSISRCFEGLTIANIIRCLKSVPSLIRFSFKLLPCTPHLCMDVLEEIFTSVPQLEELCIILTSDNQSPERSTPLYRGSRKSGKTDTTFTEESWGASEREQRFPCAMFGK